MFVHCKVLKITFDNLLANDFMYFSGNYLLQEHLEQSIQCILFYKLPLVSRQYLIIGKLFCR